VELRICAGCRRVHPGLTACPGCSGPLTLADERLFLGEQFGKYRLESVLGAGGMGIVYRAIHGTLDRPAALKIVMPQLDEVDEARFQKRFLREARVLAELKHPNIVEVYDFDVSAWGTPYYVMECLEGATLDSVIRGRPGALGGGALAAVLADVASGLAFAHKKGVVHRDLKPENIFVAVFDGRAVTKIMDFGIAKSLATPEATHLTRTGTMVGTPGYAAPEQILGEEVGTWTDQYALALIVAELLRGRPVRAGKTLGQIIREDISRPLSVGLLPPDVPEPMRAALQRATAPLADARFPDVAAFVGALQLPPPEPTTLALALGRPVTSEHESAPTVGEQPTVAMPRAPKAPPAPALPSPAPQPGTVVITPPPATVSQAPTSPLPVAAAPRRWGPRRWSVLAAVLIAALAAAALWRQQHSPRPPARPKPSRPALAAAFQHRRTIALPPDASAALTQSDETLVLQGGGALYLLAPEGGQVPARIPLGEAESVLGRAPNGQLWVLAGSRLLALDAVQNRRTPLVDALPALEPMPPLEGQPRVLVSPSGGHVALVQPGAVVVYAVREGRASRAFSAPRDGAVEIRARLSDRYLVLVQSRRELTAYTLDGERVLATPFPEQQVFSIAVLDDADLVAVGGWYDHVDVHGLAPGGRHERLPLTGGATDLAWIADRPTLVMGGAGGLAWWRGGRVEHVSWGAGDHQPASLLATGSGLASIDPIRKQLALFDYGTLAPPPLASLAKSSLWAVESDEAGKTLFVGGSDGTLYVHRPDGGTTEKVTLHGGGITDLARRGDYLTSTSDDKTIAVWQLPRLGVIFRSTAHAFLVNQMYLQGNPATLWSASSDGTLKRWAWPQLEQLESVDASTVLAPRASRGSVKYSLQALWVDAEGTRVLAGTWGHALLVFDRRRGRGWQGRAIPVVSDGLYRAAGLPALDAVVLAGLQPPAVYLYDLAADRLHRLRSFDHEVYAAVAGPDGREAYVLGNGAILRYSFSRGEGGAIDYEVSAETQTALGRVLAATLVSGRRRLAAVTAAGDLAFVGLDALAGPTLAREELPPAP
jgi:serine/threonine-protein kinase